MSRARLGQQNSQPIESHGKTERSFMEELNVLMHCERSFWLSKRVWMIRRCKSGRFIQDLAVDIQISPNSNFAAGRGSIFHHIDPLAALSKMVFVCCYQIASWDVDWGTEHLRSLLNLMIS